MKLGKLAEFYYTAAEARKKLGVDESTFQYWGKEERISRVYLPGRKQPVYSKKEIDDLVNEIEATVIIEKAKEVENEAEARLISERQPKMPTAKFVKATVEDIPSVALAGEIFEGLNSVPVQSCYFVNVGDEVVGYALMLTHNPEQMKRVLQKLEGLVLDGIN